jgi:hypothetical protein
MPPIKVLPKYLKPYFWDYSFSKLSLKTDRDLIIRRVLTNGSWNAILWLRKQIGDAEIREWLITHHGRGLSARQLRFWELIYDLPTPQVNEWVSFAQSTPWDNR